jgi:hypothetical protein
VKFSARLGRAVAAVALGIGGAIVAAQPAQAIPAACEIPPYMNANWARAHCTGGTGQFRLRIICDGPASGAWTYAYSRWRTTGATDYANCSLGWIPRRSGWQYQFSG